MKFSIVTVCRNSAATLCEAMSSLSEQTLRDYEWVLVDGGSHDDTLEIAERFTGPRGAWSSEPDNGIYDAMNKGVRRAHGEYLYFLNSDDRLHDSRVLADVDNFIADANFPDLVYGNVVYQRPNGSTLRTWRHIHRGTLPFEDLCHQAVFARRDLFDRIGLFNTRFVINADYDWIIRVFRSGVATRWFERRVAVFRTGGMHMRDVVKAQAERREVRLQYMSEMQLFAGDLWRRARHRWHRHLGPHRLGQIPLEES